MSELTEGQVLLFHASDALEWAHFIATRLAAPAYEITCKIHQLESPDDNSIPDTDPTEVIYCNSDPNEPWSDPGTAKDNSVSGNDLKPKLPEKRGSRLNVTNDKKLFSDEISNCRACVILVSPNIVESKHPLQLDMHSLKTGSTVFIFLGVELMDARDYFGSDYDVVTKCKCGFVYSTEQQTITDALVQIIEAYEDTGESEQSEEYDDIYNVPTNTRQLNVIEKVFPKKLSETERDVCIVLSWPPEDSLQLMLEDEDVTEREIQLTVLGEKLYMFTLPDDIVEDVYFHLKCQDQTFGRTKLQLPSKLERLRAILEDEINPLALLASAINISQDDLGEIDVSLAHKLQQLSPSMKLQNMFPFEDDIKHSHPDRPSSVKWPTLLHFAAEWNLRTLCSELLRYPGMVLAACTENCDREYPSQIASRKGFSDLEANLLQFVEKERESEYIEPSPPLPPPRVAACQASPAASPNIAPRVAPKPKINKEEGQPLYCDMTAPNQSPIIGPLKNRAGSETLATSRPNSVTRRLKSRISSSQSFNQGDTKVKFQLEDLRKSLSQDEEVYVTMEENLAYNDQLDNSDARGTSLSSQRLSPAAGSPTSKKALKRLGVCEADIRSSFIEGTSPQNTQMYLSTSCPPGRKENRTNSIFYVNNSRESNSSSWDEDENTYEQAFPTDVKRSLKKEKIKSFFNKIKGGSKRVYDSNLGKKLPKGRRGSEQSETKSLHKSQLGPLELERDSGSYSDEEHEPTTAQRRINKEKGFKQSDKSMVRRLSKRVESVKKETISIYPSLPRVGDKTIINLQF